MALKNKNDMLFGTKIYNNKTICCSELKFTIIKLMK